MQRSLLRKLIVGFCLVLPFMLITFTVAQAAPPAQGSTGEECQNCHGEIHSEWEESMHGQAASDIEFLQAWKKEGSPADCMACHTTGFDPATGSWEKDGVDCVVCHDPVPADHPNQIMPTNATSEACGTCHTDTFAEWQSSTHGEESLACVNCHSPHTTDLKVANSVELCQTCHNEEGHFYSYTAHAEQGLLCTDCHLRVTDGAMGLGEGHSQRLHTFDVDLRSCTQCHGEEMHYPVENAMGPPEDTEVVQAGFAPPIEEPEALEASPESASPFTYILAAVVGLGVGIILTPGIEALYRRIRSQ